MTDSQTRADTSRRPFPFFGPTPLDPPPVYRELQLDEPVSPVILPSGDEAWLVTRHRDVEGVLRDERMSRQALTRPGAPAVVPVPPTPSLFFLDPPAHTRLRALAEPAFTAAAVAGDREVIEEVVCDHLTRLCEQGPPADVIAEVARPLPLAVVLAVLGVPSADRREVAAWTGTALGWTASPEQRSEAFTALHGYLAAMIDSRRAAPGRDLLSRLVTPREGDQLADPEVIALVFDLIGAGSMPVTAEIAHLVLNLVQRTDGVELLHRRPELVPTAVEELLRVSQAAGGGVGSVRIARTETEIGGVMLPGGAAVIPSLNAANADPDVFPDPGRLDLGREVNPHLAFGAGAHVCLGMALGRLELQVLLSQLAGRLPGLRLAVPAEELVWTPVPAFATPDTMPVRW